MKKPYASAIGGVLLFLSFWADAAMGARYVFDCTAAKVKGSIRYSVIGHYKASFDECRGVIDYDQTQEKIREVELEISAQSIRSNCAWCDKIVLSKRLLDAQSYPKIIYTSDEITSKDGAYVARGRLDMHGVVVDLDSDFSLNKNQESPSARTLHAKGQWVINRKDFGIIWSKTLDRGGILVSDEITVDWDIEARPAQEVKK